MEQSILSTVADLMALSARTAPKGSGKDFLVMKKLTGADIETLAKAMDELAQSPQGKPFVPRDAGNIRRSGAVLLLGLKNALPAGLDCGGCGFDTCGECKTHRGPEFNGPVCAIRLIDLGIALGSAVKTAMNANADNRIMYSVGSAAIRAGIMDADIAMGIPLSASGKSIYFDRTAQT